MVPLDAINTITHANIKYSNYGFFIDDTQRDKPEIYFDGNAKEPLLKLINEAKESIDIQMFSFTNQEVIDALKNASTKLGILIRILLRSTEENIQHSSELTNLSTVKLEFTKRYLHRKLAVFDNENVWIGSTNWSGNGFESNSEVDMSVDDPELADDVLTQYETDWLYPDGKPKQPSDEKGTEDYYVGNKNPDSMKFHRPSCGIGKKIATKNRVTFKTRQEAIDKKYSPCGTCKP